MKLALVTTPPGAPSRVGDAVRALLPHLRRRCARVDVFVAPGRGGAELGGEPVRGVDELELKAYDQLVYEVGDEAAHGFMARMLRTLGGTVALHDWALPELAVAARPALLRGGLRARLAAIREGGVREGLAWAAGGAERRALGPGGDPDAAAPIALNRSVVRHGDAFLVPHQDWKQRLLVDRNQHTPVGVVAPGIDELADAAERAWEARAARYVECLATFPPARAARKRLIVAAFHAAERARAARSAGEPSARD